MISLCEATNRNTKCLYLDVAGVGMVVSYTTVVAAAYKGEKIRRINQWGTTTGRHMGETNCRDWPEFGETEFERRLTDMVLRSVADMAESRLTA